MISYRSLMFFLCLFLAGTASAGSIDLAWRLNPEVKKEALFYARTGGVVNDSLWRSLSHRRDLDPDRFDRNHPNIAGYFTPPAAIGRQPHGPVLDELRRRFEIAPVRFAKFHPFWGRIFALEPGMHPIAPPPVIPPVCPCQPPEGPQGGPSAIPEPSSIILLGSAIVAMLAVLRRR